MSHVFPPTFIAQINKAIQLGRGAAAQVLGQTYTQQRLSSTTNGSVTSTVPIATGFPARIRRTTKKVAVENAFFDILVYEVTCNNSGLELQDLMTETGYGTDGGLYTVAQFRPTRETLWVRTETNVSISRIDVDAGSATEQPAAGAVASPGYAGTYKATEAILTLTNGLYSFQNSPGVGQPGAIPTPAGVQVGLQPTARMRDASDPKFPVTLYREEFFMYIPLLPGVQINELDRINFPNSDRYEVGIVYTTDLTGLSGYIVKCEKLSV